MDYPKLGDYLHDAYPGQHRRQRRREGLSGRVHGRLELGLLGPHGQQEEDRRPPDPAVVPWTGTYRGAGGNPPRVHREQPPLQGQRRQRPVHGEPVADAERLLRHQDRRAGLAVSRGRPVRRRSVRRPPRAATPGSPTPPSTSSTSRTARTATTTGPASGSPSAPSTRSATCGAAARSTPSRTTAGRPARSSSRSTCRGPPRPPTTSSAASSTRSRPRASSTTR